MMKARGTAVPRAARPGFFSPRHDSPPILRTRGARPGPCLPGKGLPLAGNACAKAVGARFRFLPAMLAGMVTPDVLAALVALQPSFGPGQIIRHGSFR